ncbi:hypothetical protein SPI_03578 [Niveomyces insectorum RCEF 264]|uniref:Uncharacterized protein n=1 Tax=Niveomyces insectorum RCEF 264 TaxID=1081102 RepID=A0A167W716_9HYPO|nr:hypothetical protein SPI_03578 [Niveomyces insectorum RCEF 264]
MDTTFWFPFCCARVVLKRHLYGLAHGVPLEKLNWHYSGSVYDLKIEKKEAWVARIVADRLLLSSTRVYSGQGSELRCFLDKRWFRICQHISTKPGQTEGLPELKVEPAPQYFTACRSSLKSCTQCMTDYAVEIAWNDKERTWSVTATSYVQVGTRLDEDWYAIRERAGSSRPPEYTPGFVRHLWSRADAVVLEPEGVWGVTEPPYSVRLWELRSKRSRS